MIYTAPCIMFWMRANPLRGEVGGGWALEFESFFGPCEIAFGAQNCTRLSARANSVIPLLVLWRNLSRYSRILNYLSWQNPDPDQFYIKKIFIARAFISQGLFHLRS